MIGRGILGFVAPGVGGAVRSTIDLHADLTSALFRAARDAFRRPSARHSNAVVSSVEAAEHWRRRWAAYVIGTAAAISAGVISAPAAPWSLLAAIPVAVAGVLGVAQCGYENWRARGGRGGWRRWIQAPGEWLPHDAPGAGAGLGWHRVGVGLAALVALAPTLAAAATSVAPAVTTATDQGIAIINAILPGTLTSTGASTGTSTMTPWTAALGVWSSALCGFAGMMLSYHILLGIIHSAHTGRPLGDKFHQTLAPLRVCIGFALLVPVPGGSGLSGVHLLLAESAGALSMTASSIWSTFASNVLVAETTATPTASGSLGIPSSVGGAALARKVLASELCVGVYNAVAFYPVTVPPVGGTTVNGRQVWDYGDECGSFSLPSSTTPATTTTPATGASASTASATTTYATARITATTAVVTAERSDAKPLIAAALPAGTPPGGGTWPSPGGLLAPLSSTGAIYDTAMTAASAAYLSTQQSAARTAIVSQSTSDGWPSAGALWGAIGSASAAVSALASEAPDVGDPTPLDDESKALKLLSDDLRQEDRAAGGVTPGQLDAVGGGGGLMARLTSPVMTPLSQTLIAMGTASSVDDIVSEGHAVVGGCEAAIVGGAVVAAGLKNWFSDSLGGGGAWDWLSGWAKIAIGAAYAGGWTQAYLLPLIPWMAMNSIAVTWTILLCEAAIALPIWAFLLIRLDGGDDIITSIQRPGLIIAINACLMPVIAVLALISSYYTTGLILGLIGRYMPVAWAGAQSGHTVTLGGLVGAYVLIVFIQYQAAGRLLAAPVEITSRVMRYWGASAEGSGDGGHAAAAAALGAGLGRALPTNAPPNKSTGGGGNGGGGKKPGGGSIRPAGGGGPLTGGSSGGGSGGEGAGGGGDDGYGGDDGGFGGGGDKWFNAPVMTPEHEESAREDYEEWREKREDKGGRVSYEDYRSYVRARHAGERG
jgi:hypothetical protein